jgi:hypothetical protein
MNRMFYIGLITGVVALITSAGVNALPRSLENMTSTPKKHFEVKMMLNKVDLGETVDVELTHSSEECKNYRMILANMHNAKEKKLDENFFQSIGLSGEIFAPFMRIYERTRRYSVDLLLDILKTKNVQIPLEKMGEEKQELIKDFVASTDTNDQQLNQLNSQERDTYHFLKQIYGEYIRSGNKVLSQEFHFKKLTGFLQNVTRNSCETNTIQLSLNN